MNTLLILSIHLSSLLICCDSSKLYSVNINGFVTSYKGQYNLRNCKYDYLLYSNNTLIYYCVSSVGRADIITSGIAQVVSQNLFNDYYYNLTYSTHDGLLVLKNNKTDMIMITEGLNDYIDCLIIRDNLCY